MKPEEIAKTVARGSVEAKLKLYFEYLAAYNISSGEEEILDPIQLERIEANYKKHSGRSEVMELATYFKAFTMLKDRLALYEARQQNQLSEVNSTLLQIQEAIDRAILIEQLARATLYDGMRLDNLIYMHGRNLVINKEGRAIPNYQAQVDQLIVYGKNAIGIATDSAELIALLARIVKRELPVKHFAHYVENLKKSIFTITREIDFKIERASNLIVGTLLLIDSNKQEAAKHLKAVRFEQHLEYSEAVNYLENSDSIEITQEEIKQFKSMGQ